MMKYELKQLGLPVRCVHALASVGVKTFAELLDVTVSELRSIPDLGAKGIEYILALVSSKGYKLEGQELYEQLKARKKAERKWVGLEPQDMPGGHDPLFDDPKFIAGMVYAANKLMEKNTK